MLGEGVYARCPHHKSTTTNTAQPHKVGALLPMPSCLGIGGHPSGSRQGHPRYTGARTTGRPWVAHTNAQRAKCTCHDAHSRQSNTHTRLPTNRIGHENFLRRISNFSVHNMMSLNHVSRCPPEISFRFHVVFFLLLQCLIHHLLREDIH